jgi:hypothetical protein
MISITKICGKFVSILIQRKTLRGEKGDDKLLQITSKRFTIRTVCVLKLVITLATK